MCEISPGAGNEFIVMYGSAVNSGTNGIDLFVETAVGGTRITATDNIGSGAATRLNFPTVAPAASSGASGFFQVNPLAIVSGTQALRIAQSGAGAQNDTFQVLINIRTRSGDAPSVVHSNSTNAANVSATAGTEAFTIP